MEKIVNLQFLRATAALMVVLYHGANLFFKIGGEREGNIFSFLSQFGFAGVDVFFVISGYIIWISTKRINGFKGVLGFVYNRATRIYLGYWPYVILFLLLSYGLNIALFPDVDILGSVFLTQAAMHKLMIDVAWTLEFELYFYFCFACLLLLPRKYFKWSVLLITVFLVLVQVWFVFIINAYHPDNFYQQNMFFWFYTSPFCIEFMMGCFIAWFFEKYRVRWVMPCFIVTAVLLFAALNYQSGLVNGALSQGYFTVQRVLFYGFGSALFLAALIELEKRGVVLFQKASMLLGGASYSMYLAHAVILYFITRSGLANSFNSNGLDPFWTTSGVVLLMIIYSVLHYLYLEKPIMKVSRSLKKVLFKTSH